MTVIRKRISACLLTFAGSLLLPLISFAAVSGTTYGTPTTTTAPTTIAEHTEPVDVLEPGEFGLLSMASCRVRPLVGQNPGFLAPKSTKYNTSVYEIETQTGINRGGRQTQAGDIKARHDYLNGKPTLRVDYDHTHGNVGSPHVVDKHANPNNPLQVNTSKPRPPEPGEYLSPVLSNPQNQGGVYRP